MSQVYNQNFDALSDGSIAGQDSWSLDGQSGTATIQSTVSYSGKALYLQGSRAADRALANQSAATYILRVRKSSNAAYPLDIYFLYSGTSYCLVQFASSGTIKIYQNPSWQDTGISYAANTWYKVTIEWDYSNLRYRVKLDNGAFSSYYSFPSAQTGFNTLRLNSAGGDNYVDDLYVDNALGADYPSGSSYTRALSDSISNAASRSVTVARVLSASRIVSDSIAGAASRFTTVARTVSFSRAVSDAISNAAGRAITVSTGIIQNLVRALSDSMGNAAGRFADVARISSLVRSAADSVMNGASRNAAVASVLDATRDLTDTIGNAASRLVTVTRVGDFTRTATASIMNAAMRLAGVAWSLITASMRGGPPLAVPIELLSASFAVELEKADGIQIELNGAAQNINL